MLNSNELYNEIVKTIPEKEISTHESDLYIKVTEQSTALIDQYEHKQNVTTFIDNIDHERWYDIPFANAEFWNNRKTIHHRPESK